jgi:asparagine synthase (glutamine-hydrolysing)
MDVDLATQMPEDLLMLTDKMSMAASLECRVPLLDQRLTALAAQIPAGLKVHRGQLKYVFKEAMRGILPDSILQRRKRGFGAPIGAWFKQELAPLIQAMLSRKSVESRGLLDPDAVAQAIAEHQSSAADRTDHLLALLILEIWCRLFLDGRTPQELSDEMRAGIAS